MSSRSYLTDVRVTRGQIWNVKDVLAEFKFGGPDAPWNRPGIQSTNELWVDIFVYEGFLAHGATFLESLNGRFAVAVEDVERNQIFMARDWIGETPFHVLMTDQQILVSNTIGALRNSAEGRFAYEYVRAFPQAHYQLLDLAGVDPECVALSIRPGRPRMYVEFDQIVRQNQKLMADGAPVNFELLRHKLLKSVKRRVKAAGDAVQAVLLSGGLDSFSVALSMKALGVPFEAYTLSVAGGGEDVKMAAEFARLLDVRHHVIEASTRDVVEAFASAIENGEIYHLFNVYCTVGMTLVARNLAQIGINRAFCGEAVNEAVGDYKDWVVKDPRTGSKVVMQRVDHQRLQRSSERTLYVWGHAGDNGKFNRQLGTGLAKHAGGRMVKPFLHLGLTLECPYYDQALLAMLIAIPSKIVDEMGGKAGLMVEVLRKDLVDASIDPDFILGCKKVRFQDASDSGEGGITAALLVSDCDQRKAIEIFNATFGATLDPYQDGRRLSAFEDHSGDEDSESQADLASV